MKRTALGNNSFHTVEYDEHDNLLYDETVYIPLKDPADSAVPICNCIGYCLWGHHYSNSQSYKTLPWPNFLSLELVTEGNFILECNHSRWLAGPGDVMILICNRPAAMRVHTEQARKYNMIINGNSTLMMHLEATFKQLSPVIDHSRIPSLLPYFQKIYQIMSISGDLQIAEGDCSQLCSRIIYEICNNINRENYPEEMDRILQVISNTPLKNLNRNTISSQCGISIRTLSRLFQQYLHISPIQYCIHIRLQKARNLLIYFPRMPIKSIAEKCGFSSAAFFSRMFINRYGITPSQFRIQWKNEKNDSPDLR